jgi:hypothetical protein
MRYQERRSQCVVLLKETFFFQAQRYGAMACAWVWVLQGKQGLLVICFLCYLLFSPHRSYFSTTLVESVTILLPTS